MKSIMLGLYSANPGTPDGTTIFKKSQTDTPYQRYTATFVDDNGVDTACICFLNAQLVATTAIIPAKLQLTEIFVSEEDFATSLASQSGNGPIALVFTNFSVETSEDIMNAQMQMQIELQKDAIKQKNALAAEKKAKFQALLRSGQAPNRFATTGGSVAPGTPGAAATGGTEAGTGATADAALTTGAATEQPSAQPAATPAP